ncbi:tRNA (adenosine(37)-N6)-dimethylallyltransferase MiaA [Mucilaginibacter aquaedulcis]|uniref:tRNA (adenosine(37)-N6)-dimethylallyltransferase MiaA n=1 Tax=Mucilaginibacter aquaedulcis TaxID=1187081 RepID=UPI0025B5F626|nr:tRNA (adenosine(37)-N6)-dimethylallyltransferase MiaA [Mucilaginibacter aquaedulcis]MDN3547614.1 tRNA (adenosine(37)-N6)-dimethylallyltransferase MiaA [Mucilaginibacter aquaedulcis]
MTQSTVTKTLIVVAGPTAVGKTAAAIELAKHYNTVVVSADSRQFFREMTIGTAKPNAAELAAVKHYFIDSHSITEPFSVGDFEKDGLALLDELFKIHDHVILAGGSGLYIKAICEGFDELPKADPAIRENLNRELEEKGIASLQQKLKFADPVYYDEVDLDNPQRIIRALEVFESSGKPISSYRQATVNKRPFNIVKLALNLPREVLYNRINARVDVMMQQGLLAEVQSLLPYRQLNALQTVGYAELFDYIDGQTSLEKAVEMIKQNTRRFAKRQLTWFRRDSQFHWFDAGDADVITQMINTISSAS